MAASGVPEPPVPFPAGTLKGYNLVIVLIDAVNAGHLGCYGYTRNTSPFIDSLAAAGVLFEGARSNGSFTRHSVTSLLAGRLPSSCGGIGFRAQPSDQLESMGGRFHNAGYRTAFFSTTPMTQLAGYRLGFDVCQHFRNARKGSLDRQLSRGALQFAEACKRSGTKFLMYLHYVSPHEPYTPPEYAYRRLAGQPFRDPLTIGEFRKNYAELVKAGCGPGEPRFEDFKLRYDAEISHSDDCVKQLVQGLDVLRLLDHTLIIVTADHGEEFFEHQYVGHSWTLYEECLRIPLIFYARGALGSARIPGRVSLVDVLPTVLDLFEMPHDRRDLDGASLFARDGQGLHFKPRTKPFIAELISQETVIVRAVVQDDWKYIAAVKWLEPEERHAALAERSRATRELAEGKRQPVDVWGPPVREELYNLRSDPGEQQNMIEEAPEKKQALAAILKAYESYCQEHGIAPKAETPEQQRLSPEEERELKAQGYL